jgi:hypothetical protein
MIRYEKPLLHNLYTNSLGTGASLPSPITANKNVAALDDSWPFILVSIGMTKHAVDALRSGTLTKEVNKRKSSMEVLHEYHHACFYCFSRYVIGAVENSLSSSLLPSSLTSLSPLPLVVLLQRAHTSITLFTWLLYVKK